MGIRHYGKRVDWALDIMEKGLTGHYSLTLSPLTLIKLGGRPSHSQQHCTQVTSPDPVSWLNRLIGLVVKASASRAEDPGFESRLHWNFFGVESYQ